MGTTPKRYKYSVHPPVDLMQLNECVGGWIRTTGQTTELEFKLSGRGPGVVVGRGLTRGPEWLVYTMTKLECLLTL